MILELYSNQFVTRRSWPHRTGHVRVILAPSPCGIAMATRTWGTFRHTKTHTQQTKKELLVREQNYCEFLGWDTSINYPKLISCTIFTHNEIVHFVSRVRVRTFLARERKVHFPKKFVFGTAASKKKHKFAFSLLCNCESNSNNRTVKR